MSVHVAFRRQPVPGQMALRHQAITLPAPIRGLSLIENLAYTKPGSAVLLDNWFPTQRGLRLRGGCQQWCVLPALPEAEPDDPPEAIISGFEYQAGSIQRIYCATNTRLFEVTFADMPIFVADVANGNFSTSQQANQAGDNYLIAVNDAGELPRRYDGVSWIVMDTTPAWIVTEEPGPPVVDTPKTGLTHVWKYKRRWFFVEGGTMNAWYLDIDAIQGILHHIPLTGAAQRGGSLLFGATISMDAGDGMDDKCVFVTTLGEVLIFTGSNPADALGPTPWRQEGRYDISPPISKNGHVRIGGDLLIETIDGIVPLSAAIQKDITSLSLAAITVNVEPLWQKEVRTRSAYPWSMCKWEEQNALFVNFPGGHPGAQYTLVINLHTGAACRYRGWDTQCFMRMRNGMFFGTQAGKVMQAEQSGYDNSFFNEEVPPRLEGDPYVATMVGGWEMFQAPPNTCTWLQARASYFSNARDDFQPQIDACTDFQLQLPPPPSSSLVVNAADVWDQGLWDVALWDQAGPGDTQVKSTMWVSVGQTGFSHAPVVQVTVGYHIMPTIELVSLAATFVRMAVPV